MNKFVCLLPLCALALTSPSNAQIKENVDSWAKVKVGGKLCLASHEHYGESPPWPSKRGARKAAIRAWEGMTTWEYGKKWGSYRYATAKRLTCSKNAGRWKCSTTARPCRRR